MSRFTTFRLTMMIGSIVLAACASPPATTADRTPNKPAKQDEPDTTPDKPGASDPDKEPGGPPAPPKDEDYIWPETIYTGFTGAEVFKVPISTNLEGAEIKWETADPSIVSIESIAKPAEAMDPTWAMLTTKKAGKTKISVTVGAKKLSATVDVVAYTAEAMAAGQARYKTGGQEPERVACASCHEKADGWDHSPTMLANYDDANTLSAIQTAVYGDGYELQLKTHKWALTEPEKVGIMAYLRALPPKWF